MWETERDTPRGRRPRGREKRKDGETERRGRQREIVRHRKGEGDRKERVGGDRQSVVG